MKPSKPYSFICYDNCSAATIGRSLKNDSWTDKRSFERECLPYLDGSKTIRTFRVTVEEIAESP